MKNKQVTITISAPDRSGVSIVTDDGLLKLPAQVDLFGAPADVTTVQPGRAAQTMETPGEPAKVEKAPLTPSTRAAEASKPWEDLSAGPKGVNLPMSPALYAKMKWVTENVPKMSLQRIARQGAEAEADRLIALHYKP